MNYKLPNSARKELAALAGQSDDAIDFSDIPLTTDADWAGAVRGRVYRPVKRQLTVRIDVDVIEWLMSTEPRGYQKRLNSILRHAMLESASSKLRLQLPAFGSRSTEENNGPVELTG